MKKIVISSFILLLFNSCIITQTPGFYNGYKQLSENEKKNIVIVDKDSCICNLNNNGKIYAINGKQLKECLEKNDTSIVYQWGPNCSSKACILVSSCQEYCTSRNYKLYVVADYYDLIKMKAQNVSVFPMLIANHRYYKKDYANSLNKKFINDILDKQVINKEDNYKRFLIFKGSRLIKIQNNLFEKE